MLPEVFSTPFNKLAYLICANQEIYDNACREFLYESLTFPDDANACVQHLEREDGDKISVIMAFKLDGMGFIEKLGVLAHEAVHVWQGYIEIIGESEPSKEFEAYTIEEIFVNIANDFNRQEELIKIKLAKEDTVG